MGSSRFLPLTSNVGWLLSAAQPPALSTRVTAASGAAASEWGLLCCIVRVSHFGGFSCWEAEALAVWASVAALGLSSSDAWV